MVLNFLTGGAAINVLCRQFGIAPLIVDAGVAGDPVAGALDLRLGRGTANFVADPAMSGEAVEEALSNGVSLARRVREEYDIAAVGEMGIGNTTSASALFCAYAGIAPEAAVGPGTGVDVAGVQRKAGVVRKGLERHRDTIASGGPIAILAALGGFEIATMAGFLLGAAAVRMPVVVDGFISSAAALAAHAISADVLPYLFFSHVSAETAHRRLLDTLGIKPILDLDMRLGEGSGAALAMPILDAAVALYEGMATFAESSVSDGL
jgi:nicotinate-nucleotide--dimethylbenzimidazole phosphoribosyltransferase